MTPHIPPVSKIPLQLVVLLALLPPLAQVSLWTGPAEAAGPVDASAFSVALRRVALALP